MLVALPYKLCKSVLRMATHESFDLLCWQATENIRFIVRIIECLRVQMEDRTDDRHLLAVGMFADVKRRVHRAPAK